MSIGESGRKKHSDMDAIWNLQKRSRWTLSRNPNTGQSRRPGDVCCVPANCLGEDVEELQDLPEKNDQARRQSSARMTSDARSTRLAIYIEKTTCRSRDHRVPVMQAGNQTTP